MAGGLAWTRLKATYSKRKRVISASPLRFHDLIRSRFSGTDEVRLRSGPRSARRNGLRIGTGVAPLFILECCRFYLGKAAIQSRRTFKHEAAIWDFTLGVR